MGSLRHILKEIISSKNSSKIAPENWFHALLCFQKINHNLNWKMKYLKESTYITYLIGKLSKLVQIHMLASIDSFL